jgi:5-methylcytosine-specific restriction endonuclease McrA
MNKRTGRLQPKCKVCRAAMRRAAYIENPEPELARGRRWKAANKELRRKEKQEWRAANPERERASLAKRRALRHNASGSYSAADVRLQIKSQTNKRGQLICWWCSKPIEDKYHIDHRIALDRGGSNDARNICITHVSCNTSKGAKLPWEYNGRLL